MFLHICPVYSPQSRWGFSLFSILFYPDAKKMRAALWFGSLHSSAARRPIFTAIQCGTQPTLAGTKTRFCQPRAERRRRCRCRCFCCCCCRRQRLWQLPLRWQCQKFVAQTRGRKSVREEGDRLRLRINDAQLCEYLAQSVYLADLHTYMDYVRQRKTLNF